MSIFSGPWPLSRPWEHLNRIKKQLGAYTLYMALCFFFHSMIISMVAFFHFQLGHHFNIIEDWVFKNCWRINLMSKGLAFFFVVRLLTFDTYKGPILRGLFRERFKLPDSRYFVFFLFVVVFSIVPLGPKYSPGRAELIFQLISYVGSFLFYFLDFLVLSFVLYLFPLPQKPQRILFLFVAPLFFYFLNKWSFPYQRNFYFFVYLQMLVLLWASFINNFQIGQSFFYTLFVIAPLSALVGLDPILGNLYSPLSLAKNPSTIFLLAIWGLGISYIYMTPKRNHDMMEGLGQV